MDKVGARGIRGEIRDEWKSETGEDPGQIGASVILDRLCDAFVMNVEGVGVGYAVKQDPRIATYLLSVWRGSARRELKTAIQKRDGTLKETCWNCGGTNWVTEPDPEMDFATDRTVCLTCKERI